jgi:hypothetical protein
MPNAARRSLVIQAFTLTTTLLAGGLWAQTPAQPAPAAPSAGAKPNLTGTYAFVQKRSDDLREAIGRAVGPDYTLNNKKSEQARVWIHSWLEGIAADQDRLVLTIEHTPTFFASGLGEEVNRYYFGREATSTGPAGGRNKVTVAWKDEQVVTTERQEKGKGTITAVYTLQPDTKTLLVVWRMEHDSLQQPLEVRLTFERLAR